MNFVLTELQGALSGVCEAILDYPDTRTGFRTEPVVALGVRGLDMINSGEMTYLGLRTVGGVLQEVYGFTAELRISADIYAPKAQSASKCRELAFSVAAALMAKLPSGLRISSLNYTEIEFDQALLMFRLPATLTTTAQILISPDDEGEFTNYELKGVTVGV